MFVDFPVADLLLEGSLSTFGRLRRVRVEIDLTKSSIEVQGEVDFISMDLPETFFVKMYSSSSTHPTEMRIKCKKPLEGIGVLAERAGNMKLTAMPEVTDSEAFGLWAVMFNFEIGSEKQAELKVVVEAKD